jgi:hypothetical protein
VDAATSRSHITVVMKIIVSVDEVIIRLRCFPASEALPRLVWGFSYPDRVDKLSTRHATLRCGTEKRYCIRNSYGSRISLYVMFFVVNSPSRIRILASSRFLILDSAVYNWPWVNTGRVRSMPILE